ncbi:hypothetical protein HY449_04460 [Candidatus Pacearchaeota archaeon]|nr:hypothetical protein [Candidatus Pacearchaeota archaeon]
MNYRYLAEDSEVCKDLEERMKKFDEYFVIHGSMGTGLIISDNKIAADIHKSNNVTAIEPEGTGKIEKIALKNPKGEEKSATIFYADFNSASALIGNSVYSVRYSSAK